MLLAIDVGNTQTAVGVFQDGKLVHHWRISTDRDKTADELAVMLSDLMQLARLTLQDISHAAVSSVVPNCTAALLEMAQEILGIKPLIVGPGIKTGMPILYDNPHEVGADRIANAVAAFQRYQQSTIIVDFGTAITFDAVSSKGEYLGGAIAPGIEISAEALFSTAAKLSKVDLLRPAKVIGKNTENSVQSGLIFGFAGLVDAIVEKMKREMNAGPRVIATGGFAPLIAPVCVSVQDTDPLLTLVGLRIIHEMNSGQ